MKTLQLTQGSEEWLGKRAKHFNSSEAAAMLGFSPYLTRSKLIEQKATGIAPEVDHFQQQLFDEGHRVESIARPLAEEDIGEDLYPTTGVNEVDGVPLLASFDGITMDELVVWEHKMLNAKLAEYIENNDDLPDSHWPQCEQQLLVSGAKSVYFMTSNGTRDGMVTIVYESVPERRQLLLSGWKQFKSDMDAYTPTAKEVKSIGQSIADLPALIVNVEGRVVSSNLASYKETSLTFIRAINTNLETDQDFADAETTVKFCKSSEDKLELTKSQALAQTATIEEVFITIDAVKEELRITRLKLEKLIKDKKESIRISILSEAKQEFAEFFAELNAGIGKPYMPSIPADFAGAMKGKRTLDSLRNAVSTEIAHAKIRASEVANRIKKNLLSVDQLAHGKEFLFSDMAQIVLKEHDDLVLLVKSRIDAHELAEQKRLADIEERKEAQLKEIQRQEEEKQRRIAENEERMNQARIAEQMRKDAIIAEERAHEPDLTPDIFLPTSHVAAAIESECSPWEDAKEYPSQQNAMPPTIKERLFESINHLNSNNITAAYYYVKTLLDKQENK